LKGASKTLNYALSKEAISKKLIDNTLSGINFTDRQSVLNPKRKVNYTPITIGFFRYIKIQLGSEA